MKVQFREQTPGVRAGEWWDPTSDKYYSVVTIKSLDGWVGYIGDKRINKDFAAHEDAEAYAISLLESQSRRRQATQRLVKFAVPTAAVVLLAFGVHSVFFAGGDPTPKMADATSTSPVVTGSIRTPNDTKPSGPKVSIARHASSTDERTSTHQQLQVAATNDGNDLGRHPTGHQKTNYGKANDALPRIHLRHAEARPWEKPLSEHAIAKEPFAIQARAHTTVKLSDTHDVEDEANETFYDLDLAADMRADKAERAKFLEEEQAEATVTRAEIKASDTSKAATEPEVIEEEDATDTTTRSHITKTSPVTPRTYRKTSVKKAARKGRAKKRSRKKSRKPLVRRVVRRNIFGQRYVVYKARRPRNAREYRKLQRIKRRIAAKRRRYYKNQYGN